MVESDIYVNCRCPFEQDTCTTSNQVRRFRSKYESIGGDVFDGDSCGAWRASQLVRVLAARADLFRPHDSGTASPSSGAG